MITAHLPSGYVLGRLWPSAPLVLPAAVLGGILPDFDMIWFYLIDDKAIHHRYWVHIPFFWAAIAVVVLPLIMLFARPYILAGCVFFAALLVHLCLDTLAGDIMWHWPWSTQFTHFVDIPARFDNWILNFMLHWVFTLELAIWATAFWMWKRQ